MKSQERGVTFKTCTLTFRSTYHCTKELTRAPRSSADMLFKSLPAVTTTSAWRVHTRKRAATSEDYKNMIYDGNNADEDNDDTEEDIDADDNNNKQNEGDDEYLI